MDTVRASSCSAIGTSHGPYKFKGKQSLLFEVICEIQQKLPDTPIVAHKSEKLGSAGQLPEVRQTLAKKYS